MQKEQDSSLKAVRAEMGEVREENKRLKMHLGQMMKDYQALHMKFYDIIQQDETKKSTSTVDNSHQAFEEPELVSLSLGRFSSESKNDGKSKTYSHGKDEEDEKANNEGDLSLRLDCKFEVSKFRNANETLPNPSSPVNIFKDKPKEEVEETWPPPKVLKTMPSGGEDEVAQQCPLKKARVYVRMRCDTPTMNDGCQWRKYGQKIAKGNPCPRAYYRCTLASSCPVRKQVQRCAEDMSILITSYEGTHNHPLPLSATFMASTTSSAASMLLSGSLSSSFRTNPNPSATSSSTSADLHGLNFYLAKDSNSNQFYLHNSSLSASPSHSTITIDLTSNPSSSQFNRFNSSYAPNPKFAPASLNFSSSESNVIPWGNGLLIHGSTSQLYSRNQLGKLNLGGRPPMEHSLFQPYMQQKTPVTSQQPLPDTIAAATKAITTDPSFQSALVAALKSIIGNESGSDNGGSSDGASMGGGDHLAQKLKWGEHFPLASGYLHLSSPTPKGNKIACTTSYLNKTTSANSQPESMFLPTSLPFPSPKSASAFPGDDRDHSN
ncbi:hypothetical protein MANES_14G075800v8 [Manihot esculenta]|nr:WRKY transcription factor 61 [Manihot esculenta]KAG8638884.1 hypothetical protein MANES_14G075800v8 [Manihot esculenta]OAY31005.1 hypothetical protein MANES_14G075800v8 [Manihot esculenta]